MLGSDEIKGQKIVWKQLSASGDSYQSIFALKLRLRTRAVIRERFCAVSPFRRTRIGFPKGVIPTQGPLPPLAAGGNLTLG